MVEMTHSPATFKLGLAFNSFLFAALGEGPGGTPINLASALARLELDPWREAAELARLPTAAAVRRLSVHLARLAPSDAPADDTTVLAATLIGLLPQGAASAPAAPIGGRRPSLRASLYLAILVAVGLFALSGLTIGTGEGVGPDQPQGPRARAGRVLTPAAPRPPTAP